MPISKNVVNSIGYSQGNTGLAKHLLQPCNNLCPSCYPLAKPITTSNKITSNFRWKLRLQHVAEF